MSVEVEQSPFDQWFFEQHGVDYHPNESAIAKAAWFAALDWAAHQQPVTAWTTEEEQPRFCSDRTKRGSLFKSAVESFNIPLYRHPHYAGKKNN